MGSMSKAAISIFVFGMYLATGSVFLMMAPDFACQVLSLDQPEGVWVRITGMFFAILAYYCICAAREEETAFMRWSVRTRPTTLVFLAVCVVTQLVTPIILIFGAVDVAAAIWTAQALRADSRAARTLKPA